MMTKGKEISKWLKRQKLGHLEKNFLNDCLAWKSEKGQKSLYYHLMCVCSVAQSCLTPRDPIGCSPPVSSIHGISQARILEWAAISFSGGPSWPRDGTRMSGIGRQIFATAPPGSGRCPGGQSNALQCPCCRLPWAAEPGATLHRVTKSPIQPERFRRHALSTRI